jgi:uncharacterized repeat protein (TIGR01451 family)
MKKILPLLMAFFSIAIQSQVIDIPDANFKTALLDIGVDTNNDGEIEVSEAITITELDFNYKDITSLEGISFFKNLTKLIIGYNDIENLDLTELVNLEYLDTDSNHELKELKLPESSNLKTLDCSYNNLPHLDLTNLTNLEILDCSANELLELDLTNNSKIINLNCNFNNLKKLEISNLVDIEKLDIGNDNFDTIIEIPNVIGLTRLNYSGANLTDFDVDIMPNLNVLILSSNKLTEIDVTQNPKLVFLYVNNNQISTLDLSNSKQISNLNCNSNKITEINLTGLGSLERLDTSYNNLTQIDLTQNTKIDILLVNNNEISTLDLSNSKEVSWLDCSFNKLTELNVSELKELYFLYANDNQITTLNLNKNSSLGYTYIYNNSLETLFIKNGREDYASRSFGTFSENWFDWQATNVNTLKYVCTDDNHTNEISQFDNLDVTVNSYCSFTPGGEYYTLKGNIKMNNTGSSCDTNSINFKDIKLKIIYDTGDSDFYSVDEDGTYEINLPEGEYIAEPQLLNPNYYSSSIDSFTANFPDTTSPHVQNICVNSKGDFNDVEINIIPIDEARPGFDADYKIVYKNVGTTPISGNINLAYNDKVLDFISSNMSITSQNIGQLNWDYQNLEPTEKREILFTMNLNSPTETPPLNSGDILNYQAAINPTENEEVIINNLFNLNQEVVNSYDPNDKTCLQGDFATPEIIGEYVHYLIRFENLGTASAINVVVKDIIDTEKFDIATLDVYDYSHALKTRIQNTNKVEFIFEGINLPFDDENNDGYVAFKIKTLPSLNIGDTLENFAEIYFDYNPEIVTNTAKTIIESPAKIDEYYFNASIKLFPKPTTDFINVDSNKPFNMVEIYDLKGSLLKKINFPKNTNKTRIPVNNLSKGVYLINFKANKLKKSMRFIKE